MQGFQLMWLETAPKVAMTLVGIWCAGNSDKTKGKDRIKRFNSDTAHLRQHYHSSALRFSVGPFFALCSFHSWSGGLGGGLEV